MKNECAWSPRGESVHDERKGYETEKMNIIDGSSEGGIVAPMIYECSADSEIFNFWLEHQLLPEIPKNSLVVLDNASFHKLEKTNELVEKLSDRLIPTI